MLNRLKADTLYRVDCRVDGKDIVKATVIPFDTDHGQSIRERVFGNYPNATDYTFTDLGKYGLLDKFFDKLFNAINFPLDGALYAIFMAQQALDSADRADIYSREGQA